MQEYFQFCMKEKQKKRNSFEGQNEGDEIDFDYFKINNWDELIEKIETI